MSHANASHILDLDSEKVHNSISVVLPTDKGHGNLVYMGSESGYGWRPVTLPYSANWDQLSHDGERFIIADSGNAKLQATSTDGKHWVDAGM